MRRMSTDEARHYSRFLRIFNQYNARERNSYWNKAKIIVSRSEHVRDGDLTMAFKPLNAYWVSQKPFTALSYAALLVLAGRIMREHFQTKEASRLLFQPLGKGRRVGALIVSVLASVVKRQYPILPRASTFPCIHRRRNRGKKEVTTMQSRLSTRTPSS